ncbi:molybdenum cofactor guanylyltransferase [Thermodesulfatator atlanticus]|uniref:molybdenum cofactor guanylyltransferase n=1 Tax=Thermodesulfatator atlanticus TaxID=501497 RepID=UPI0003B3E45F|nr:molybdenum cofactor guanylyltransferase [Thermodesulfatator atlanticus]
MIGLILAGGRAVRFGGGKCKASLAGKPLINWVFNSLKEICDEVWLSIREEQKKDFDIQVQQITYDETPGAGPAQALLGALRRLPSQQKFLLATSCDQPLIQEKLLKELISFASPHYKAVLFKDETGRLLPFPGIYHKDLSREKTIKSFKEIVAKENCLVIPPDIWRKWDAQGLSFYNVNYRDDLLGLEKHLLHIK